MHPPPATPPNPCLLLGSWMTLHLLMVRSFLFILQISVFFYVSILCYILLPLSLLTWIFSCDNLEMFTSLFSCWIISSIVSGSSSSSLITFVWRVVFKPENRDASLCLVNMLLAKNLQQESECGTIAPLQGPWSIPCLVLKLLKAAIILYPFVELPNSLSLVLIGRL